MIYIVNTLLIFRFLNVLNVLIILIEICKREHYNKSCKGVLKMISEKRQSLILQELKKKIFITPRVN